MLQNRLLIQSRSVSGAVPSKQHLLSTSCRELLRPGDICMPLSLPSSNTSLRNDYRICYRESIATDGTVQHTHLSRL